MKRAAAVAIFLLAAVLPCAALRAAQPYAEAKACYRGLKAAPSGSGRAEWERCAGLFEAVHEADPQGDDAARALFSAGRMRAEMCGRFKGVGDAEAAIRLLNDLVRSHPDDSLADDALYQIGRLRLDPLKDEGRARRAFEYIIDNYPDGDMAKEAKAALASLSPAAAGGGDAKGEAPADERQKGRDPSGHGPLGQGPSGHGPSGQGPSGQGPFDETVAGPRYGAVLDGIDVEEGEAATIVTLTLSRKAAYSVDYTPPGPRTKSPPRLDLLLAYTKPSPSIAKELPVSSPHVRRIQLKRPILAGGTSLHFEIAPGVGYDVQAKGGRITLRFGRELKGAPRPPDGAGPPKARMKTAKGEGAKGLVIVVDPGHGGADTGAVGKGGTKEKDVALAISKRLASILREELGARVHLTRAGDATLTLEERNAIAVAKGADLFISVHANASPDRGMRGIETYFLNNASDAAAAKLAKRENRAAAKKLSDVEHILSTMLQNYDAAESELLASDVQRSLIAGLGRRYEGIRNRRVRSALFYVLVGAKCPAILVESSFISNPAEERRLKQRQYQADVAGAIARGVHRYLNSSDKRMVKL